ncbi:MAG: DUF1552 domain-containing protein [Polyangiaceae bacterium]
MRRPAMPRQPLPRFVPRFRRRSLLAGLGASMALAPFIPQLEALADGGAGPRRLILFFTPHGMVPGWEPTGTETDFTLSPILAPLAPFQKDNLIVLRGMRIYGEGGGGPHTRGCPLLFTGSEQLPGDDFFHDGGDTSIGWGWNISASVDQVVAESIANGASPTAFKSLELGFRSGGGHPGSRINYTGPAAPLTPVQDPKTAFETLFADFGKTEEEMARLRARRLPALHLVDDELDVVRKRVSKDDTQKMEAHLEAIRAIEKRIEEPYSCDPQAPGEDIDAQDAAQMGEVLTRHIGLITQAFACDLTRVATLQIRVGENDGMVYPFLGSALAHHEASHMPFSAEYAEATKLKEDIRHFYATKLAELMASLAAVPEVDGLGSMLDNTMIVWGSELSEGLSHSFSDMPFFIGGGKRFLHSGRSLVHQDASHSRLLVTMLHAMGLTDYQTFGDNDVDLGSGPLDGILI